MFVMDHGQGESRSAFLASTSMPTKACGNTENLSAIFNERTLQKQASATTKWISRELDAMVPVVHRWYICVLKQEMYSTALAVETRTQFNLVILSADFNSKSNCRRSRRRQP